MRRNKRMGKIKGRRSEGKGEEGEDEEEVKEVGEKS
jgi:hypothetical protein